MDSEDWMVVTYNINVLTLIGDLWSRRKCPSVVSAHG